MLADYLFFVFLIGVCIKFSPGYCCLYPDVTCEHCTGSAAPAQYDLTVDGTIGDGDSGNDTYCWGNDECAGLVGTFRLINPNPWGTGFGDCCWGDIFGECPDGQWPGVIIGDGEFCPKRWEYCLDDDGAVDRQHLFLYGCTGEVSQTMIHWRNDTAFSIDCFADVTGVEGWDEITGNGFDRCTWTAGYTLELVAVPSA